ncbi:AbrB/MazE/SpoVT family DNA-binding domain-containing protein [Candidatus Woesearchaeota archaeon]|nr:AbrB/MazE/SpoVT family DNA-binding domain-containing protein [Candidatus Woesearchaeota archaeon]
MRRKLVKQGGSALTVSLPSKWVKKFNLNAGDEIEMDEEKNNLLISKDEIKKGKKKIVINIDNYSYLTLARYVYGLYRSNYDKIILIYKKSEIVDPKKERSTKLKTVIRKIVGRMVGAEIVSQSSERTDIECFVTEENPDLEKIEKRIFFLFKETYSEIMGSIGPDYEEFHKTMYDHHDTITKFINYYLRELDKSNKSEEEKKVAYSFYMLIDNLIDKLRHLSERINKFGCSNKVKKYMEESFEIFFKIYASVSKGKIPEEVIRRRYEIKEKLWDDNLKSDEAKVIMELMPFIDVFNDFSEYSIIKGIQNETDNI